MSEETPPEWLSDLPEPLREAPFIGKAENVEDAVAKLAHAAQLVGTSIRIPGSDADDDARNAFYDKLKEVDGVTILPTSDDEEGFNALMEKLGKPGEFTDYDLPALDDFEWDEKMGQTLREYALEAGMTKAQFAKFATKIAEQERGADSTSKQEAEERRKELRTDWGDTLEEREALIRGWMEMSEAPSQLRELLESRDLPLETMNWLYGVAKEFKGDVAPISKDGTQETGGPTPAEARAQATEIMNDMLNMKETDPRYADLQRKLVHLNGIASRANAA